jgi:hypothetical protein
VDIKAMKSGNGINGLLSDLISQLKKIEQQCEASYGSDENTVAVVELIAARLKVTSVKVEIKMSPQADMQDANGTTHDPIHEPQHQPATVLYPPAPEPDPRDDRLNQPKPQEQFPLALERDNQNARAAATFLARDILTRFHNGELTTCEELLAEISLSPMPDVTLDFVVNAKTFWRPLQTSLGEVNWGGMEGITGLLASAESAIVEGRILSVDETMKIAKVSVLRCRTNQFAEDVKGCVPQKETYAKMKIATADTTERMTHLMGSRFAVRLSAAVLRPLAANRKSQLVIGDLCVLETDPARIREATERLNAEVSRRPPQLLFWDEPVAPADGNN